MIWWSFFLGVCVGEFAVMFALALGRMGKHDVH